MFVVLSVISLDLKTTLLLLTDSRKFLKNINVDCLGLIFTQTVSVCLSVFCCFCLLVGSFYFYFFIFVFVGGGGGGCCWL